MSSTNNETLFKTKVIPIMDKVMKDLRQKQLEEIGRHTSSLSYIMAGAAGPDGGMSAQAASLDSLRYTGEWNSKHTEDYIQMVKDELKKQGIEVTPEIERMMIDKMIQDEIPKSSIEYIMRKAATNTIFYLPQAISKSPLEDHITERAEKRYNPSTFEKGTGYALGAAADYLTMGGLGGWKSAASFIGTDMLINGVADKVSETPSVAPGTGNTDTQKVANTNGRDERYKDVPLIVASGQEEAWLAEQERLKAEREAKEQAATVQEEPAVLPAEQGPMTESQPVMEQPEQPEQTNANGWNGLFASFGLDGISDIGHNLGYVLAMLPDILVGMFTGKTRLNIKDNLLPIASIAAGMFTKNPILKMILIGMGGLNLLNKAGHEALEKQQGNCQTSNTARTNYRIYPDESLNPRIGNPQLQGNCLIAVMDKVPYTIALPDTVVDAYRQGALPLNTLANAVLAKNDQMRQMASQNRRSSESKDEISRSLPSRDGGIAELNYEAGEQQTVTRTLAQR